MRILLYEFVSSGGWRSAGWALPADSLAREGAAMLDAVANDFRRIDGVEVQIANPGHLRDWSASADFDWTVVIAPETGGVLNGLLEQVQSAGGRLLGPSLEFARIAGDKQATAERLAAAGVSVPTGVWLASAEPLPRNFPYPAVLKPADGAGSQDTWLLESADVNGDPRALDAGDRAWRLERYAPGLPASAAFLCGPREIAALLPCGQRLSPDGRFAYLGGFTPLPARWRGRAVRLGEQALSAMPPALGYIGVDLVLGEADDGSDDYAIEINPRLTTSYVSLRALCQGNLAQAMLDVAAGRSQQLSWRSEQVEFDPDGRVRQVD